MKYILINIFFGISLAGVASCATVTYETPAGATYASLAVDFTAVITTAANSITVVLENNESSPTADTQMISGLTFTLGVSEANAVSITSQAGQLINIASKTSWSNDSGTLGISPNDHWEVSGAGGTNSIDLNAFAGSKPADLVVGDPGTGGEYSNANASITGHNPSVKYDATFTLLLNGVTTSTQVTSATFNVGTQSAQPVAGIVAVPEPGSFVLVSLLVPFVVFFRSRTIATRAS